MTDQMMVEPGPGERVPPHDEAAEVSVIGAVLLSKQALEDVSEAMRPADFYQPRNELILTAALALAARGAPVDAVTVIDELQRTGRLVQAGGATYLHRCTTFVPTAANAGYYAEIVASKAVMRRLVEAGTRIVEMGYASEGEPSALVEGARAEVDGVTAATIRDSGVIGSLLDEMVDQLKEKPELVPTPWPALDRILGGFAPGRLYVVAARPGKGKSALTAQIAVELAKHGPVGMASLEMGKLEILQRLVSSVGQIPLTALTQHQMLQKDWNSFVIARPLIHDLPLHVRDDLYTFTQIASFARSLHRQGRMQGLVIDYLQLVTTGEKHSERRLEIDAITRACKELARSLNIPVFLISQLSRAGTARGKGKEVPPLLTDLRESGSIEQDCDVVVFLYRDDYYNPEDSERPGICEVIVAKQRNGPRGTVELPFRARTASFTNAVDSYPPLVAHGEEMPF